ncbi:MAG: hypothetical protein EU551_04115 [Promethearchaeota archaeon]|nr:MAG: hypothetical protein EU551_04115 [Candidatus Lokiarchaeota archaeon]
MLKEEINSKNMGECANHDSDPRKGVNCANHFTITLHCELIGYDLKPLNSTTQKGNYMLKIGQKVVEIPIGKKSKSVRLTLYKMKSLRGFLRRACERRIFELIYQGKSINSPCTPNAHYPNDEILQEHLDLGYHVQGSCKEDPCFIYRLFGGLDRISSITITSPIIAKSTSERLSAKVQEYLKDNISDLLHLDTVVLNSGDASLKVEIFNIINRHTENAVNNFMKHTLSGNFIFKIVFTSFPEKFKQTMENIGFLIDSLFEINNGSVQLGADRKSGAGFVTMNIIGAEANRDIEGLKQYIIDEKNIENDIMVGSLVFKNRRINYILSDDFLKKSHELFMKSIE